MPRQIKFEEEVGEIEDGLLSGTFDEVVRNLSMEREKILKSITLEAGEELVLGFDPFEYRGILVYRRAWEAPDHQKGD